MAPGAGQRRQAGHGPHGIAAAAHALHAVIQANGCGLAAVVALAIVTRQLANLLHWQAADFGSALRRPLQGALFEFFPAQRVLGQIVVIEPVVGDEFMHQRQRQRRIGAGAQLQMLMAFVRSL